MTAPSRRREAARKRSTDQCPASACLGTEANTPRARRRTLPAFRCWASIAVTTLSLGERPMAAAYSVRLNTGVALKKGVEIKRDILASCSLNGCEAIYDIWLSTAMEN